MASTTKKRKRHQSENFLFALMGLILLGLLISGYFLFVDKLLPSLTGNENNGSPNTQQKVTTTKISNSGETLLNDNEGMVVTLYFAAHDGDYLVRETRKIPEEKLLLNQAGSLIRELLKGPLLPECRSVIPNETTLRGLFYNNGMFIIDFSKEFAERHPGGAIEEALTLYSIVNTLTELDKKAKVKFLLNGTEVESIAGHIGLKNPLSRYEALTINPKG